MRTLGCVLAVSMLAAGNVEARPWSARVPPVEPGAAHQLLDLATWPEEPPVPAPVEPARFRTAVERLCRRPAAEATRGDDVLAAAGEAGVDPFLLAALMYQRSRCNPTLQNRHGFGLLAIHPDLYRAYGAPPALPDRSLLNRRPLLVPTTNLTVGARLLRMWQDEHARIDAGFTSVPHRSAVSHFVWGDVVESSGHEDLILTTRRRMLAYYEGVTPSPRPNELGIAVVPPLDGGLRVASSGPGDLRDNGKRRHAGLDIVSLEGEPVRSIGEGTVIFAGANLNRQPRRRLSPAQVARWAHRRLGKGGIYVCIRHAPAPEPVAASTIASAATPATPAPGSATTTPASAVPSPPALTTPPPAALTALPSAAPPPSPPAPPSSPATAARALPAPPAKDIVSCYMHLESFTVATGASVHAGQAIGYTGRTGVQSSPAHLHIEIRIDSRRMNPLRYLREGLIPPQATRAYLYAQKARRDKLRTARAVRARPRGPGL